MKKNIIEHIAFFIIICSIIFVGIFLHNNVDLSVKQPIPPPKCFKYKEFSNTKINSFLGVKIKYKVEC